MGLSLLICVHLCIAASTRQTSLRFGSPVVSSALADSLLASGRYFDAATEYRRLLFQQPDSSGLLGLKLGIALGLDGETGAGTSELRLVRENHPDLAMPAVRGLAGLLASSGRAELAIVELEEARLTTADSLDRERLARDVAWLELTSGNLDEARRRYGELGDSSLARAIAAAEHRPRRNPDVAVTLSSLVPGTGEVYAGRFAHGIGALAVTAGSAWVSYEAAKSGDYLAASLLFSLLFLRFYTGSRANAQYFAEQWNANAESDATLEVSRERPGPDWLADARRMTGVALPAAIPRTGP